jgi:anti-anti-sigma factor
MKSPVEILRRRDDGSVVARLRGDIDMAQIPKIQAALEAALSNAIAGLIIDLSGVRYFDSLGIRLLFDVKKRLQQRRQPLLLVVPDGAPIRHIFAIVNIDHYVQIHGTLESARAVFSRTAGVAAAE